MARAICPLVAGLLLLLSPTAAVRNDDEQLKSLMARVSNASSLAVTAGGSSGKKSGLDIMCTNFCFACEDGTPWEIHRAQSTATKLAKLVGGTLAIAAIASGLGPIVAVFGLGATVVAGVAGGAHLAMELHKEKPFCPEVEFSRESETDPASMTLDELNLEELLLLDTEKFTKESTKWAVACNYMILSISKWEAHGTKKSEASGSDLPKLQGDVIKTCGRWLCSGGAVQHSDDWKCGGSWWKKTKRFFR